MITVQSTPGLGVCEQHSVPNVVLCFHKSAVNIYFIYTISLFNTAAMTTCCYCLFQSKLFCPFSCCCCCLKKENSLSVAQFVKNHQLNAMFNAFFLTKQVVFRGGGMCSCSVCLVSF